MAPPPFPHKCLAFHGPMLYEAKTLKIWDPEKKTVRTKASESNAEGYASKGEIPNDLPPELEKSTAFYIHYKGWKSTWDEWVNKERVLEWNDENLRTQKELKQMALAAASKKKHGTASSVAISVIADGSNHHSGAAASGSGAGGANGDSNRGSHGDERRSLSTEPVSKKREGSHKDDGAHLGRSSKRGRGVDMELEKVCIFYFILFYLKICISLTTNHFYFLCL